MRQTKENPSSWHCNNFASEGERVATIGTGLKTTSPQLAAGVQRLLGCLVRTTKSPPAVGRMRVPDALEAQEVD